MVRNIFADDWFDRGVAQGMEQGRNEGISQGAHDACVETARKLKLKNFFLEEIYEITELSTEEIAVL